MNELSDPIFYTNSNQVAHNNPKRVNSQSFNIWFAAEFMQWREKKTWIDWVKLLFV